jgi:hypothetical protein
MTRVRAASKKRPPILWGAAGHMDQLGSNSPYQNISIAQMITDLHNVFGTKRRVLYRAVQDDQAPATAGEQISQFQAAGIDQVVNVCTYPPFATFADQTAAYNWANSGVTTFLTGGAGNARYYEIGNEWTINSPTNVYTNNGELASDWTGQTYYARMLGVVAGATAAIRDHAPGAKVIGGATAGWKWVGLAPALAQNLGNYAGTGRDLTWDYTCLHWYDDAVAGNNMGDPSNFSDEFLNAYVLLKPANRPLMITEFGSSNGNNSANNASASTHLTTLIANFLAHAKPSATEPGVAGAMIYQMYQEPNIPQMDFFLYTYAGSGGTGTIAAQGTAVKNAIAAQLPA